MKDIFPTISKFVGGKQFTAYHSYYCKWEGSGQNPLIILPQNENDFKITVDRGSDEMFVSLETSSEFNQLLLTQVYAKQDGQWKLYNYHVSSFKIADKNAVQWYQDASTEYAKGNLISALLRLELANETLQPTPVGKYALEGQITDFTKILQTESEKQIYFPSNALNP